MKPIPTYVFPDNSTLYVVFRFGAWVRLSYNNSQAVAPVAVYFYSRTGIPATVSDNYNHTVTGSWGLLLNLTKLDTKKPLELWVKYRGKTYHFRFRIVKALKEQKKEKTITMALSEFKSWLDREAQAATVLAVAGVVAAVMAKRRLLLVSSFNALNLAIIAGSVFTIYYAAERLGHSPWLAVPFAVSYFIAYKVYPVGRKVLLLWLSPSLRRVVMETVVLYRTLDGRLAVAKQSIGEAIRRWMGRHIYVVDAETRRVGELPSDKLWTVEDVNTLEKMEGMLILDAELRKARLRRAEKGWVLDERELEKD